MKKILVICGVLSLIASSMPALAQSPAVFDWFEYTGEDPTAAKLSAGQYHNPILPGFYPDPSVCRAGDDYYLINSTFGYFPGLPLFHSKDLVNWEQIANVISRPGQLRYDGLGISSNGIYAPTIRYNGGTFYVICTQVGSNGNFLVTAKDPAGPWSDPIKLDFAGIDPSIFFDDDGRTWGVNNDEPDGPAQYDGHRAIRLQELDLKTMKMVGPRKVIVNGGVDISKKPIWIEGPHLYKRDGWYYLSCAEGGTGPQHSQVVFRSRNVDGPYEPWDRNPILTQRGLDPAVPGAVTCTGHADIVEGPDGRFWAVFLGVRPYDKDFSPMGRETFLLPVDWPKDGWPTILPPNERVPLVVKSPDGATVKPTAVMPGPGGNFYWKDDFSESALSPLWIMLRTPKQTWWKIGDGHVAITPQTERLSGRGNPSYLARRVQHAKFTASTLVDVPKEAGVSAGLVAFQNERYNYFIGVRRGAHGAEVFVESNAGRDGGHKVLATVSAGDRARVKFRIVADDAQCSFDYADEKGEWKTLVADADARILTTETAGGFVGATVGIYAYVEQPPQDR